MNTDSTVEKHHKLSRYIHRLPINKHWKGHIVAIIGEFIGTFFFLFPNTGDTVITDAPQATPQQLLYTALAFGFSLAVNAWVFFRISGGLFNPAAGLELFTLCSPD